MKKTIVVLFLLIFLVSSCSNQNNAALEEKVITEEDRNNNKKYTFYEVRNIIESTFKNMSKDLESYSETKSDLFDSYDLKSYDADTSLFKVKYTWIAKNSNYVDSMFTFEMDNRGQRANIEKNGNVDLYYNDSDNLDMNTYDGIYYFFYYEFKDIFSAGDGDFDYIDGEYIIETGENASFILASDASYVIYEMLDNEGNVIDYTEVKIAV